MDNRGVGVAPLGGFMNQPLARLEFQYLSKYI